MSGTRNYRATLTSPMGETLDLTPLLDMENLGSVSQELEDDLTQLTHSDFDLTIDNSDGTFEKFMMNAAPEDTYEFVLERERTYLPGWDRIFGGVLDIPSLAYDDERKTADVTAFSYSKLMERASAVDIIRSVATKTATISSGGQTLTLVTGTFSDVIVGDTVEIDDGDDNSQTFTVNVVGSTTLTTIETADQAYTAATLTITTPFHRDKTPDYLLGLIAAEAGLDAPGTSAQALATYPIATPMPIDGLNKNGIPFCCTPSGGYLSVVFKGSHSRKKTNDPAAAWVAWASASDPLVDWTPYMDAEPGTIATVAAGTGDIGKAVHDHAGNSYYIAANQGGGTSTLSVYKNGVAYQTLDSFAGTPVGPWRYARFERSAVWNYLWYSFVRGDATKTEFGYVDLAGPSKTVIDSSTVASFRYVHQRNALLVLKEGGATMDVWDMVSLSKAFTVTLPNGVGLADIWSARAVGVTATAPYMAWICRGPTGLGTYVAIFETTSWQYVTSYKISDQNCMVNASFQNQQDLAGGSRSHITRFATASESVVCGYAGGEWFVLAMAYAGVIRYADFSDMSCAKAAREVALLLNSLVSVGRYRELSLVNRIALGDGVSVADIGAPLTRVRRPISEIYRASVKVTGTDDSGNSIEVVAGDVGASASRLEVESDLATTEAVLTVVAASVLAFVSAVREQVDADFVDDGTTLTVFDRITTEGKDYVIYSAKTDLSQGEHSLVLLGLLT